MDQIQHGMSTPRMKPFAIMSEFAPTGSTCSSQRLRDDLPSSASSASCGSDRGVAAHRFDNACEYASGFRELREPKACMQDSKTNLCLSTARRQQPWAEEWQQLWERIAELEATVHSRDETIDIYRSKLNGLTAQLRQRQDVEAEIGELQKAIAERDEAYRILDRRARQAEQSKLEYERNCAALHEDIERQMQKIQDQYVQVVDNLTTQLKAMTHERDRVADLLQQTKAAQQNVTARSAGSSQQDQSNSDANISFTCSGADARKGLEATRLLHLSQRSVIHTTSDQREARRGW